MTDQPRADAIAALHTEWHGPECGGRCEVMRFVAALAPADPTGAYLEPSDYPERQFAPADPTADLTERWRQMRYHPDLKGKSDEYIAGWDAATRVALAPADPTAPGLKDGRAGWRDEPPEAWDAARAALAASTTDGS